MPDTPGPEYPKGGEGEHKDGETSGDVVRLYVCSYIWRNLDNHK